MKRRRFEKGWAIAVVALLMTCATALAEFATTANPVHPNGTRAQIDLPTDQHMRNTGGSDGHGLCVNTSLEVGARWHNHPELKGLQAWSQRRPGGSYPQQVAKDLPLFAASKGVKVPSHIQHTGGDIEFLKRALKTRRMVGMTYSGCDPFYGSSTVIAHMVNGTHLDNGLGSIVDNNQPGSWRWMSDTELTNRWLGKLDNGQPARIRGQEVGGGWVVVWLGAPPPPIDTTSKDYLPELSQPADPEAVPEDMPVEPIMPDPFRLLRDGGFQSLKRYQFPDGVRVEQLHPRMRYWVNGVEVDRPSAFKTLEVGDTLADDSAKPFLSLVCDDKELAAKLVAAIKPYADRLHVTVYASDSWVVKTRLKGKVTGQLPVAAGGKTVFASDTLTADEVVKAAKKVLGIVDVPPAPVMPDPPKPGPVDPVKPSPVDPTTKPEPGPNDKIKIPLELLLALGAFLIYWFSKRSA